MVSPQNLRRCNQRKAPREDSQGALVALGSNFILGGHKEGFYVVKKNGHFVENI